MERKKYDPQENPPKILTAEVGFNKHILQVAFELEVGESAGVILQDIQEITDRRNEDIKRVENDLWHAQKADKHYITGSENLQYVINNLDDPSDITSIIIIRPSGVEIVQRPSDNSLLK